MSANKSKARITRPLPCGERLFSCSALNLGLRWLFSWNRILNRLCIAWGGWGSSAGYEGHIKPFRYCICWIIWSAYFYGLGDDVVFRKSLILLTKFIERGANSSIQETSTLVCPEEHNSIANSPYLCGANSGLCLVARRFVEGVLSPRVEYKAPCCRESPTS